MYKDGEKMLKGCGKESVEMGFREKFCIGVSVSIASLRKGEDEKEDREALPKSEGLLGSADVKLDINSMMGDQVVSSNCLRGVDCCFRDWVVAVAVRSSSQLQLEFRYLGRLSQLSSCLAIARALSTLHNPKLNLHAARRR
jgi:hypothetical protein